MENHHLIEHGDYYNKKIVNNMKIKESKLKGVYEIKLDTFTDIEVITLKFIIMNFLVILK